MHARCFFNLIIVRLYKYCYGGLFFNRFSMIFRCFNINFVFFVYAAILPLTGLGQVQKKEVKSIVIRDQLNLSLSPKILERPFLGGKPATFFLGHYAKRNPDGSIVLDGKAEIRRYDASLKADKILYDDTDGIVHASGDVILNIMGSVLSGPYAFYKIDEERGYVLETQYVLRGNQAKGKAEKIEFFDRGQSHVIAGTYSTCQCDNPDWYLRAKRLDLDQIEGIGKARNVVLYFKKLPVFFVPYVTFPLTKERRSGVLPPHVNFDTRNGFDVQFPLYFNLAPNYDFFLRPRVLQKHGIQWRADYRFLTFYNSGIVSAEFLPFDRILKKKNRYSFQIKCKQRIFSDWSAYIDAQSVSDNTYALDLVNSEDVLQFGTKSLVKQEAGINYNRNPWSIVFKIQNWQYFPTASAMPYSRWPEIDVRYLRPGILGFDCDIRANATNFETKIVNSPKGKRMFLESFISYPVFGRAHFMIPAFNARVVSYALKVSGLQNHTNIVKRHFSLIIPTISFDTGVLFNRTTNIAGHKFLQTLEPRVFYAYTPYVDQSIAPIFDAAPIDSDISNIFNSNNYVGHDRMTDGSRITFGLSSSLNQMNEGDEIIRFTFGQQYFFKNQRTLIPGESLLTNGGSDIWLSGLINIRHRFRFQTLIKCNPNNQKIIRRTIGLVWTPIDRNVINFTYRSFRMNEFYGKGNKVRQAIASAQWLFKNNSYGVARINYSLQSKKIADAALGFQYDKPCWTFGLALQRYAGDPLNIKSPAMRTRIMMQLELKGLANINNGLISAFRSSVPGYLPPPSLSPAFSRFTNYN